MSEISDIDILSQYWPESERLRKVFDSDSPRLNISYTMPGLM